MDGAEKDLLTDTLRKAMTASSGQALDSELMALGWPDLLADLSGVAIPVVFRLLGETGAHAPLLNDVLLAAAGQSCGGTLPLPYAGGRWVVWDRTDQPGTVLDDELPLRQVPDGVRVPLGPGRLALGWWLAGAGRAMLAMARAHALDRAQFGRPIASFQAVRHKLAETLVALEGAEAALNAASDDLGCLLGKAAAGQAALIAARHCQQILGGIGFTAEYGLHRHVKRALVLDCLLGSTRELTREAGQLIRRESCAPRLVQL